MSPKWDEFDLSGFTNGPEGKSFSSAAADNLDNLTFKELYKTVAAMRKKLTGDPITSAAPSASLVQTGFMRPSLPFFRPGPLANIKIIESEHAIKKVWKSRRRRWGRLEWIKQYILNLFYRYDYTPIEFYEVTEPTMYLIEDGSGWGAVKIVCHPSLAKELQRRFASGRY